MEWLTSAQSAQTVSDQVMLALVALVATSITALVWVIRNGRYVKTAADQATQANDAVNHKEHGETRIFEQVREIRAKQDEFDRKWGNLPASIDNAVGLNDTLHDMSRRLDGIESQLVEHIAWETNVKWPAITKEVTP